MRSIIFFKLIYNLKYVHSKIKNTNCIDKHINMFQNEVDIYYNHGEIEFYKLSNFLSIYRDIVPLI